MKKGDIVVNTGSNGSAGLPLNYGDLLLIRTDPYSNRIDVQDKRGSECNSSSKDNYRLATSKEIQAYKQGIRNIKDIKITNEFLIY